MSSQTDLLSIPQCAKILRTTRQAIGQAIKNGRIAALRFGHVKLVPRASLEADTMVPVAMHYIRLESLPRGGNYLI